MRMWGVDVTKLCNKHLQGEHVEMHMFIGSIRKKVSLKGYLTNKLVNVAQIQTRHDELAEEMVRRTFSHQSPILPEDVEMLKNVNFPDTVDVESNILELRKRCTRCKV